MKATIAALAMATAAQAGTFPHVAFLSMGFHEVGQQEVFGSAAPTHSITASCDFNHDGVVDEARLLLDEKRGELRVVAAVIGKSRVDTYVLQTFAAADFRQIGLEGVRLGNAALCDAVHVWRVGTAGAFQSLNDYDQDGGSFRETSTFPKDR